MAPYSRFLTSLQKFLNLTIVVDKKGNTIVTMVLSDLADVIGSNYVHCGGFIDKRNTQNVGKAKLVGFRFIKITS